MGTTCIVSGAVGAGLLVSGIGFVAGMALEAITGDAGLFDIAGVAVLPKPRSIRQSACWRRRSSTQSTAIFPRHWRTVRLPMSSTSSYLMRLKNTAQWRKSSATNTRLQPAVWSTKRQQRIDQTRPRTGARLVHEKLATSESPSPWTVRVPTA